MSDLDKSLADRYLALNAFRGLVCLQILLVHTYIGDFAFVIESRLGSWFTFLVHHFRFGYGTFFVLAGFFLAASFKPKKWSHLSVLGFFSRRILRLLVPYWVAFALGLATFGLSSLLRHRSYEFPSMFESLSMLLCLHDVFPVRRLPSVTFWFLAPLVQFYFIWLVFFWLIRRLFLIWQYPDYHVRAIQSMVVLTFSIFTVSWLFNWFGYESTWEMPRCSLFLCAGCIAYWKHIGIVSNRWLIAVALSMLMLGVATSDSRRIAASVAILLIPFLADCRINSASWPIRFLNTIGVRSFSIYLTQSFVVYRLLNVPYLLNVPITFEVAVFVLFIAMALAISFGFLFYAIVEKPAAKLAARIEYRSLPDTAQECP